MASKDVPPDWLSSRQSIRVEGRPDFDDITRRITAVLDGPGANPSAG